jgi:16S rRNA (cytosine1402-N4)-methyltransferase
MHKSVLVEEVIEGLDLKEGEVFVDATFGAGGHTKEILKRFPKIQATSIDQDPEAHADITGNFRNIDKLLGNTRPDAILFDLGFSSIQLDQAGRGLSFLRDEPLDMRMSLSGPTAADILNSYDESAIELILRGFGEEKYSRVIAKRIVERRAIKPFQTTKDLVEVIGGKQSRIHPATRTFQALRIAVNQELTALEEGLEKAYKILKPGGRLAVISFHSLEDRIVKRFAKEKTGKAEKPITPSEEEREENPRSRSAKLRIIKKIS